MTAANGGIWTCEELSGIYGLLGLVGGGVTVGVAGAVVGAFIPFPGAAFVGAVVGSGLGAVFGSAGAETIAESICPSSDPVPS